MHLNNYEIGFINLKSTTLYYTSVSCAHYTSNNDINVTVFTCKQQWRGELKITQRLLTFNHLTTENPAEYFSYYIVIIIIQYNVLKLVNSLFNGYTYNFCAKKS